jgi:hypothetical protein
MNEAATDMAEVLLNRREESFQDDQYIRGYLAGVSACIGWSPEVGPDED